MKLIYRKKIHKEKKILLAFKRLVFVLSEAHVQGRYSGQTLLINHCQLPPSHMGVIANQSQSNNKNLMLVYCFIIHLNRLPPESSTEPSGLVAKM